MTSTSSWPTTSPPSSEHRSWTPGRVIAVILGSVLALVGLGLFAAGAALTLAATTQRDADGYFHTNAERLSAGSYAITSDEIDLGTDQRPGDWGVELGDVLRVRLRATPADREVPVFVGIGGAADVRRYLRDVPHDEIQDIDIHPFRVTYRTLNGGRAPDAPADEELWVASSEGSGRQTVEWKPTSGRWVVVVMNADASRGVATDVAVGVQVRHLWVIIGLLLGVGVLVLGVGVVLILMGTRRAAGPTGGPPSPVPGEPSVAGVVPVLEPVASDPVVLTGRLEEPLNRWLWLVKWLLAIPHFVVLAVLWLVVFVLTVVAGCAILFTGRYPRGIFDFNVGVLRWTWRVSFYATGVLGTDRYPPFTLGAAREYPATLEIAYPESLSRGLVVVKWWLLAIPHYVVLSIIGTGLWWGTLGSGRGDGWHWVGWGAARGGLLGILVLIALVRLLFAHRYPRDMFDLVMGLNRWVVRVAAYALLMTDVYPPFRLDQGGATPEPVGPNESGPTSRSPVDVE